MTDIQGQHDQGNTILATIVAIIAVPFALIPVAIYKIGKTKSKDRF